MLEVIEPIKLEHTLSQRTLDIIMKRIGVNIHSLLNPRGIWLLGEQWINEDGQIYLNNILRSFWYQLQNVKPERNALLAYEYVDLHNDSELKMRQSTVFIPITTPPWTRFLHFDRNQKTHIIPLEKGSILIFDQNHDHKLVFPRDEDGEEDASFKLGIALCLDKIPE